MVFNNDLIIQWVTATYTKNIAAHSTWGFTFTNPTSWTTILGLCGNATGSYVFVANGSFTATQDLRFTCYNSGDETHHMSKHYVIGIGY